MKTITVLAAVVALLALSAVPAHAARTPGTCKTLKRSGTRIDVIPHRVSCAKGVRIVREFLFTNHQIADGSSQTGGVFLTRFPGWRCDGGAGGGGCQRGRTSVGYQFRPYGSSVSASRECGERVVANPAGGYSLIIDRLRVQHVSCNSAARVAARVLARRTVGKWRCRAATTSTRCRRGASRFSFVSGGDAG